MEAWRQWPLGGRENLCSTKPNKIRLDSDRPSHGRPLHFYEKVIKVKADVAALHIFPSDINDAALGGVESCQGRPFLAFISTLDRSPRHYIIERRTKRNAVQLSFVP
jgi:hypothetical protein